MSKSTEIDSMFGVNGGITADEFEDSGSFFV